MSTTTSPRTTGNPWLMLALATVGFAVNFWAWALLSPLGPRFKQGDAGDLTASEALLVAVPVVVGSLGRIPVGALTDRYGGRVMFPLVSAATIVPVLYLGFFAHPTRAAGGRVLPGHRRHGVRRGRAVRQRLVPARAARARHRRLRRRHGRHRDQRPHHGEAGHDVGGKAPFLITAAVSPCTRRGLARAAGRTGPPCRRPARPGSPPPCGCRSPGRPALYAVAFGGYVAFSVYLPDLSEVRVRPDAGRRGQPDGRVRAAGGRDAAGRRLAVGPIGPIPVLAVAFAVVALCGAIAAAPPPLAPLGTIAFLAMAAALGAGSGATFALVALPPADKVAPSPASSARPAGWAASSRRC